MPLTLRPVCMVLGQPCLLPSAETSSSNVLAPLLSSSHLQRCQRLFHWRTGSDHYQGLGAPPRPSLLLESPPAVCESDNSDLVLEFLSEYVSISNFLKVSSTDESTVEHDSAADFDMQDLLIHWSSLVLSTCKYASFGVRLSGQIFLLRKWLSSFESWPLVFCLSRCSH